MVWAQNLYEKNNTKKTKNPPKNSTFRGFSIFFWLFKKQNNQKLKNHLFHPWLIVY